MNLNLPEVLVDLGPEWAQEINTAFEVIDEHDHSSGKGVSIKTSGIEINADLTFSNYSATNLNSAKFRNLSASLSGVSNSNSVYTSSGDLYFTNSSGVAIQITSGGSIVSTPAAVQSLEVTDLSSNLTISPSDTFVFISVDTSASRDITLPLASSVSRGRIYVIKDVDGLSDTNVINLLTQGSDTVEGESSLVLNSPNAATWFIGDGISSWHLL